jgi:hypothetical protein
MLSNGTIVEMSVLKKNRTASILLIAGITFLFSIASVYSNYSRLMEADFLVLGVKFESGDIDGFLVDKQINLDFIASQSCIIGSLERDLPRILIISSCKIFPLVLSFFPLRC